MNLISIIVPVYNVENYIAKCIDSILAQTYKDIELILVDDGSTDNSGEICDEYALKDDRIRVYHKKNGGSTSARNLGLKSAKGEFIGFVDADDWIEPEMYERLIDKIQSEDVDVVICGRYEDREQYARKMLQDFPAGKYDKDKLKKNIYSKMIAGEHFYQAGITGYVWDKLYRRKILEQVQYDVAEDITIGEDSMVVYPAMLIADSVYILKDAFYHYVYRASSITKAAYTSEQERDKFHNLYKGAKRLMEKYGLEYRFKEQWRDYFLWPMVSRAYFFYKDIEQLDYLFPFPKVKKNSNVIIYCMGVFGKNLWEYLEQSKFCKVVAVADRDYEALQKQGIEVISPEEIRNYSYDAVLIANTYYDARCQIYNNLLKICPKDKIYVPDEVLIRSEATWDAFGLDEGA